MQAVMTSSFGTLLKDFRHAAGLTQGELAERADLREKSISALEAERRKLPRRETVQRLAKALNLSEDEVSLLWAAARGKLSHDREAFLAELFPGASGDSRHNLPPRYGDLVGRQDDLARVLEGLASRWPVISIHGFAGVGKTTLALHSGYTCLPGRAALMSPPFDAAVWISATDRPAQKQWLTEVLDTIARVLRGTPELSLAQKQDDVERLLRQERTLVIIDNYETIEEPQLEQWILAVPEPSKVLVTSRVDQLPRAWGVPLGGLAEPEAIKLIRLHAKRRKLSQIERAHEGDLLPLVDATGGNPKAIVMALALVHGPREIHELQAVVDDLGHAGQDVRAVFDTLYTWHWAELHQDAKHVLFAMSFFVEVVDREALQTVAGLSGPYCATALRSLRKRFLLETKEAQDQTELPYSLHPLTRAFVGSKLAEQPDWEQGARERWVWWCLRFAEQNARQVGKNPAFPHEPVRKQWKNLLAATAWCAAPAHERYDDYLKELWREDRMRAFSGGLGYWDDRVQWLDRLIEAAERRGGSEMAVAVDAMSHQAWTLTTMGQLAEADKRLARAWELREHVQPLARAKLARHRAWLCIHQRQFAEAERWLGEHGALLTEVPLEEPERARELIHVLEYRGMMCHEQQDYGPAEELYRRMLEDAKEIEWARARLDAQNALARVAMARGALDRADDFLRSALQDAQDIDDLRGIASCKQSLARLERLRGNRPEACRRAREALEEFKRVGRQLETEELRQIIAECCDDETAE